MRRLPMLALLTLCFSATALGGVGIGGSLPPYKLKVTAAQAQRFGVYGQIKAVRWVAQTGRSVRVPVKLTLTPTVDLTAPEGEWSDVILEFEGDLQVEQGDRTRTVRLSEVQVALDAPVHVSGGAVALALDWSEPDGLWSGFGPIEAQDPRAAGLADGVVGALTAR